MAPVSADNVATEQEKSNVIRFNVTKNELYKLDDGYKTLMRRQKGYFKIVTNTQSITSDAFTSSRVSDGNIKSTLSFSLTLTESSCNTFWGSE